jgi:hypothetical protein
MPVLVSFMTPGMLGRPNAAIGVGIVRATEVLTVPATTTNTALPNEIVVLSSTEANTVRAAIGGTPDAAAATLTSATGAGFAVPPGILIALQVKSGDKINVKAIA